MTSSRAISRLEWPRASRRRTSSSRSVRAWRAAGVGRGRAGWRPGRGPGGGPSGGDDGPPGGGLVDGPQQLHRRGVLDQEPARPGPEGLVGVLVGVEGGEDHDLGRVGQGPQLAGGGDAVQHRHADVHERHLGGGAAGQRDRLGAVGGLPDHLDAVVRVQQGHEPGPDQLLVVDHQDPDPGPSWGIGGGRRPGRGSRRGSGRPRTRRRRGRPAPASPQAVADRPARSGRSSKLAVGQAAPAAQPPSSSPPARPCGAGSGR